MRRSTRVTALAEKVEKEKLEKIEAGEDEGIKVIDVGEKGCGVAAEKDFRKGEYVCTYQGDLVLQKVALER